MRNRQSQKVRMPLFSESITFQPISEQAARRTATDAHLRARIPIVSDPETHFLGTSKPGHKIVSTFFLLFLSISASAERSRLPQKLGGRGRHHQSARNLNAQSPAKIESRTAEFLLLSASPLYLHFAFDAPTISTTTTGVVSPHQSDISMHTHTQAKRVHKVSC
jgi:hypothetical protein